MKNVIALTAAIALLTAPFTTAYAAVSVSGSTSVSNVVEVLAETYQKSSRHNVDVQGTGSSSGILAAKNGTSMIGMSSRELRPDEAAPDTQQLVIARDGIALIVNNNNPVESLTREQIKRIYRKEITNWQEVGGDNKAIVVVTRDASSGTREAFEKILGLKRRVNGIPVTSISAAAQVANGNGMVKTLVANNDYAISYISLGSVDDNLLKSLKVDNVEASEKNILSGQYSIARPFILLFKNELDPQAADFIRYIMSDTGQSIVAEQGYIRVN
ncbi:phosphate ABC transporter substrate-binding protein [Psychromonas ossibalaenae]|uniref:phosphate ABC transporter substrate-binding protein n=1 Tax=Psychromonas ossibalaenae TaxID=444922 RepID=UPI00036EFEA3|nr:phosphate ABC transporter substrate-binding protein [Psychromonas ossibalaenae]